MEWLIVSLLLLLLVFAAVSLILSLRGKKAGAEQDVRQELQQLEQRFGAVDAAFTRSEQLVREEFARNREETGKAAREDREELAKSLRIFEERVDKQMEEMRKTVDENLKDTVEKRFNDSFRLISERLEMVHKGLGEMQQLASGVGDLKRVLTNVKTKGILGEIQLGAILEQMLSPGQYEEQASVRADSQERVDFVVKLPDKNSRDKLLLLPIDSKFPTEDYLRLTQAYEDGFAEEELKKISNEFERSVKTAAKSIHDKYINPPVTTDFAVLFVPTEGLYAEIVRRTSLFEELQQRHKITVVGPTNLAAFLSSLQMGFRTLAIERRSNEVWELLGDAKREFGKFGIVVDKLKNKLESAVKEVDGIGVRSRAIERTLRSVDELPGEVAHTPAAIELEEE